MVSADSRKVAIIGCGLVGSACAFSLMQSGLFSEMVLIDAATDKAEGEALDISHGLPFARPMEIRAGSYDDLIDAAVIVVTAGAARKPGETRLDLAHKNVRIMKSIMAEVSKRECQGVMLVVSNPVDILTHVAVKYSGMPENRVIGSGTVLDSARLKYLLGEHLDIDSRSVHAFIIGEHGESEFAAWSCANVSSIPLRRFCEMRGFTDHERDEERITEQVKNSAHEVIEKKGATYFGIAMVVKRICEAIVRDEKSVLTVSSMQHGRFGVDGVVLSMPSIVGKNGLEDLAPIDLNEEEQDKLRESARVLKELADRELALEEPQPSTPSRGASDFRFLQEGDTPQLNDLIELVEGNLPDETWWPPIRQEVRDHLLDPSWSRFAGHFDNGKLTATAGLFLEPRVFDHLAEAAGLDPSSVAEIGRCMVRPSRRGANLMLSLCNQLVDCAVAQGKSWIIAAVHPDNVAGIRSLEQLGMAKKGGLLQDGTYPRDVYAMKI